MASEHRDYGVPPKTLVVLRDGTQHALATPGARLGARIIDGILLAIVAVIVALATSVDLADGGSIYAFTLLVIGFSLLYEVSLIAVKGQTLGKQALGVKVITIDDGSLPGYGKSFGRWVIPNLAGLIPYVGLIGLIGHLALLWDNNRQSWWDKVAGTVVVRTDRADR